LSKPRKPRRGEKKKEYYERGGGSGPSKKGVGLLYLQKSAKGKDACRGKYGDGFQSLGRKRRERNVLHSEKTSALSQEGGENETVKGGRCGLQRKVLRKKGRPVEGGVGQRGEGGAEGPKGKT